MDREQNINHEKKKDTTHEKKYTILQIDEEDFGCEGRPDGVIPKDIVKLISAEGTEKVIQMEDALLYERKLDEGDIAVLGTDGTLYRP